MKNGWVKLHRKALDNDQLFGSSLTFGLFAYLLLQADEHGVVELGRFQLAKRFRSKPSTIYQTLKRLESNNQVTLQSNNRYTTINIVNWSKYQNKVTPEVNGKQSQSNTLIRIKNKKITIKEAEKIMNRNVQGIIKLRRELKWSTPFRGAERENEIATDLLRKDDYPTIIRNMKAYARNRAEQFMPQINGLDDFNHKYPSIKERLSALEDDDDPQIKAQREKLLAQGYK